MNRFNSRADDDNSKYYGSFQTLLVIHVAYTALLSTQVKLI
jgi:hypothetical protein